MAVRLECRREYVRKHWALLMGSEAFRDSVRRNSDIIADVYEMVDEGDGRSVEEE